MTSCCQTTGRIDASLRGQRAGGDRSLAVKLEPGDLSGDQAPIVFTPVELTCLRSVGYVQALVAASCDRQVSTPHVFGPVYPPHLLRWRALRLRPQLSYWAIMHLNCSGIRAAPPDGDADGNTVNAALFLAFAANARQCPLKVTRQRRCRQAQVSAINI